VGRRILGGGSSLRARGRALLAARVRGGAPPPARRRLLAPERPRRRAGGRRGAGARAAPALPDRTGGPPRSLPRPALVRGSGGAAPRSAPPSSAKLRHVANARSVRRDALHVRTIGHGDGLNERQGSV